MASVSFALSMQYYKCSIYFCVFWICLSFMIIVLNDIIQNQSLFRLKKDDCTNSYTVAKNFATEFRIIIN